MLGVTQVPLARSFPVSELPTAPSLACQPPLMHTLRFSCNSYMYLRVSHNAFFPCWRSNNVTVIQNPAVVFPTKNATSIALKKKKKTKRFLYPRHSFYQEKQTTPVTIRNLPSSLSQPSKPDCTGFFSQTC